MQFIPLSGNKISNIVGLDDSSNQVYDDTAAFKKSKADTPDFIPLDSKPDLDSLFNSAEDKYNIPRGMLRNLAMKESSLNPSARNPDPTSTAGGLFQINDATAKDWGVQDRFDPAQATDATAKALKARYDQFGDWGKAAVAHNLGAGAVAQGRDNPAYRDAALKGVDTGNPDFIPLSGDNSSPDFLPLDDTPPQEAGPYKPMFNGDFTAPMLNRMKEVANDTVDAFKQSPKDAALGMYHGATAGLVNFLVSSADILPQVYHMIANGKTPQEALQSFHQFSGDVSHLSNQAITNILSIVGADPRQYLEHPPEAFTKAQEVLGLPGEPFEAANKALAARGHPELGALAELGGNAALAGMVVHGALKGRTVEGDDLKKTLEDAAKPDETPPTAPTPTTNVPDIFEWDGGAARADALIDRNKFDKTEANPNDIPEGLPRRMDKDGNLIPTNYDKVADTEISRSSIEDEIRRRDEMMKQDEVDQAYREKDAQDKASQAEDARRKEEANARDAKYSDEDFEPSQGSRQVEKIQPPQQARVRYRPNNTSTLNSGLDVSDLVGLARTLDTRLPLDLLTKLRGLFREQDTPNPDSLAYLREQMKGGQLPNPDDKPIIVVHDKGAAIYDGNHRIKVAGELGWKDMPVTIKDYSTTNQLPSGKGIMEGRSAVVNYNPDLFKKGDGGTLRSGFDVTSLFKNDKDRADYEKARDVVGRNDMSTEDFMKKFPKPTQDMMARGGLASGSWRTLREHANNADNVNHGIHTIGYLLDQAQIFKSAAHQFIVDNFHPARMAGIKAWGNTLLTFDHKGFMNDMNKYKQFEKSPETWMKTPDQWYPTYEQLREAGLSRMGSKAFVAWGKAAEAFWPHIEQFAKDKGIPIPDRIPAWIPHFTTGGFKVKMYKETGKMDAKGDPIREYLATAGAYTAADARVLEAKFKRYAQQYAPGVEIKTHIESPTAGNDTADIIKGVFEMQDRMQMNKGLQKLVERAQEQAAIGNLKSAMERKKNPQILHDLDRVGINNEFQLTRYQAFKAMHKMYDILENVATTNMRAEFLTKVLFPLQEAGYFRDVPQTRKNMIEYMSQFLRIPDTAGALVDNQVNDFFVRHGIDPRLVQDWSGKITGGAAAWYLFYKPAFYAVQIAQKLAMQGLLGSAKAEMILQGHDAGSPVAAALKSALTPAFKGKLENGMTFRQYAEKSGIADTSYVHNMSGTFMRDPIAAAIERQTRTSAFQTSYYMFRKTMNEKDAINAAEKLSKQINVDYSAELGKPTSFSKEGEWMKPMFMFMQYSLHQLQGLRYQYDVSKRAIKAGDARATLAAVGGLSYNLGMMVALGGLAGLPLAPLWNDVMQWINEHNLFPKKIPTTLEIARALGGALKKVNVNDDTANFAARTAEFGLYSQVPMLFGLNGYDVSPSAGGPTISEPTAYLGFLKSLATAAGLAISHFGDGTSQKELGQQAKGLPTPARGIVENYIRNGYDVGKTAESIKDLVTGAKVGNSPKSSDINLNSDYTRTPTDQAMNILGLKSIGEKATDHTDRLDADFTKFQSMKINNLIQQFKENPDDPRLPEKMMEIGSIGDETLNGGKSINQVFREIMSYQESKQLTETQRRQLRLKTLSSIAEYQRWQKEKELQPVR